MRSKLKITSVVVLLLVITGGVFAVKSRSSTKETQPTPTRGVNQVDYSTPSSAPSAAQKRADEDAKVSSAISAKSPTSSPQAQAGSITISRVSQPNGSPTVSLRTILTNIIDGTCQATFSKSGQSPVLRNVSIVYSATYYSCAPIDVPASEFEVSGAWSVNVKAFSAQGAAVADSATRSVVVQK